MKIKDSKLIMEEKDMELKERYKILIEARNFHYENFSKWMTYFYIAIGALFVAYCKIVSEENVQDKKVQSMLEYLLPILGFLVSILWYWSAKGYYYWHINFINLINNYEKNLLKFKEGERIYFVFANKELENNYGSPISGANISTTKIAILFAFIITTSWGFIFFNKLFIDNFCNCWFQIIFQIILSLIAVFILSRIIPERFLKSKHDHFPDLKLNIDE